MIETPALDKALQITKAELADISDDLVEECIGDLKKLRTAFINKPPTARRTSSKNAEIASLANDIQL